MSPNTVFLNQERRVAPRTALEAAATVRMANQEFRCRTRDLSTQGLALMGHESPVPAGTFMRVEFKLPNETRAIDIDGVLVQASSHGSGLVWGLKLIELRVDAQERIEKYLDDHRPPEHDASRSLSPEAVTIWPPGARDPSPEGERMSRPKGQHETSKKFRALELRQLPESSPSQSLPTPSWPHPVSAPDTQWFELYEKAMSAASLRRSAKGTKTAKPQPSPADAQSAHRPTEGLIQHVGSTNLDVELQWLYEQATATGQGRSNTNR
jgi:hypothetical protein